MTCAHSQVEAALDRWLECHWHIHQMEGNYHYPDPFRYALNSYIRALKEIPQILRMELQNHADYRTYFQPAIASARSNALIALLHTKRDFIVHRGMLDVESKGSVGTTEGRGIKISFGFHVNPTESTPEAYVRFKAHCKSDPTIRSLMGPDCDSWPMIRREWKLPELPETELLEVAVAAWQTTGTLLSDVLVRLRAELLDSSLSCRHEPERMKVMEFSQREFFLEVDGINIDANNGDRHANSPQQSSKPVA